MATGPSLLQVCLLWWASQALLAAGWTHWVVTEDGRIQQQFESPLSIKRTDDLVMFMRQAERTEQIAQMQKDLLAQKIHIEETEDKETNLEQTFYKTDPDCRAAKRQLTDFDLYISTVLPLENKGIRLEDYINISREDQPEKVLTPVCSSVVDLPYSIHSLEHLEGIQNRKNLSGLPEPGLRSALPKNEDLAKLGHWIADGMEKNQSSWVLYNLAAFYWRIKGNANNMIECTRRALHYSPREHRDVALLNLANILHRAHYSEEAAVVTHASLDISRDFNVKYFHLGNVYAVLSEYNRSVECFDKTIELQRDFDAAIKRRHAVLCHFKLEKALEAQHRSLERTLSELKEYQRLHEVYLEQIAVRDNQQSQRALQFESHLQYQRQGTSEGRLEEDQQQCTMKVEYGKQIVVCNFSIIPPKVKDTPVLSERKPPLPAQPLPPHGVADSPPVGTPTPDSAPPADNKLAYDQYRDPLWPSREECDAKVQRLPGWNEFPTTYLPPENKGFQMHQLLNEAVQLTEEEEHALPWYKPVCTTVVDLPYTQTAYDHVDGVGKREKLPKKVLDNHMKMPLILAAYRTTENVHTEEIGQRILSAIEKKAEPLWTLFNLAGLYWRVAGNPYQAIECIRRALHFVPSQYTDVPLVNMANVLHQIGKVDDAITLLHEALRFNDTEPITHFTLGTAKAAKGQMEQAMESLETALDIDPSYTEAFETLRILRCYKKFYNVRPQEKSPAMNRIACQNFVQHNPAQCKQQCRPPMVLAPGEALCIVPHGGPQPRCQKPACQKCNQPRNGQPLAPAPACMEMPGHTKYLKEENNASVDTKHNDEKDEGDKEEDSSGEEQDNSGEEETKNEEDELVGTDEEAAAKEEDPLEETTELTSETGEEEEEVIEAVVDAELVEDGTPMDLESDESSIQLDLTPEGPKGTIKLLKAMLGMEEGMHCQEGKTMNVHGFRILDQSETIVDQGDPNSHWITVQVKASDLDQDLLQMGVVNFEGTVDLDTLKEELNIAENSADKLLVGESCDDKSVAVLQDSAPSPSLPVNGPQIPAANPAPMVKTHASPGWPTPDDCHRIKKINVQTFTSTWLSVTAKDVNIHDHINFKSKLSGPLVEPVCTADVVSMHTLDHLDGVANRSSLNYGPELGLKEVLQTVGGDMQQAEEVGTRIAKALAKNQTSWILLSMAALYWRVEGNGEMAIDCLRQALHFSQHRMKDVALIGMANIFHRTGLWHDARVVAQMAVEIAPHLVVNHFTLANIYAAMGDIDRALKYYELTVILQGEFAPAMERLRTLQCNILMKRQREAEKDKQKDARG
ncbi:PREDICTED: tetratricopeptide repeat protein 17-like isoform X3 [Branchiostoma belcheri]|uniref:Tetratricopeptide repeat protein 17-like isoform X3 n=1 Tax=Branchiostoma belcheri TaxID=7741 RepID=A0A6P5AHE8_BRABE|nr:PREDICTED: tetratricopeptide repeat protein 17-like isoform X3 [Branchiostoma belcheri]